MSLLTQADLDKLHTRLTEDFDRPWTGCHHPRNSPNCCNDALSRQPLCAGLVERHFDSVAIETFIEVPLQIEDGLLFAYLVDTYGAVELDQVHRFRNHWERTASLRLRAGDPGVLTEYERHGRLHAGTPEHMDAESITAWEQARGRGETVALMANSTDTVARLNRLAQYTRIKAGELDITASRVRAGDEQMLVGDEVVTRRNDRSVRTDRGLMVKNRDHWTIETIHPDHSLTLTGRTGTIRLPAEYVAEHLELGYAQTSHATQGRTVDTAVLLIDSFTDSRGVYTPLTRGRDSNHAYVVVEDNNTALDVFTQSLTREWIDQPAVARWAQLDPHHHLSLPLPAPGSEEEFDRLEQHVRRLVPDRRAGTRATERTSIPGPELTVI